MAAVEAILQLYPMLPAATEEERERRRPLGRDRALYHRILHEWLDIVKAADDLGFWGISTIEHHFHSEGYEVGPTPGVLNAWWAGHVKRARIGALGYVMATQDPVRVAEETAILDHILQGRFFAGFARGYQSRWANVLGQFSGAKATLSDQSADDELNRRIFEERMDQVLECWTQESVHFTGQFYEVPYPYEQGIEGYPGREAARRFGAVGEIGPRGEVQRVSVVPAPYQRPHPPVFVAASSSMDSILYCARKGFVPVIFSKIDKIEESGRGYYDEARRHGHRVALGERMASVRWVHITESRDAYLEALRKYDLDIYKNFYAGFFPKALPADGDMVASIEESGIFVGGTLEETRRRLVEEWKRMPAEYITLIWHYAQQPKDDVIREMELVMSMVLPDLPGPAIA